MTTGYIYILVNPAMPNLAKVGKTTRRVDERCSESSSGTGVPASFIKVYEQPVKDCHASEKWVHAELDRRGFRFNKNREFFNAPLHEIVEVVTMSASIASENQFEPSLNPNSKFNNTSEREALIEELWRLAEDYESGTGDVLRSPQKALELYEQAANLGDEASCTRAAKLYMRGDDGIKKDAAKSLLFLKKALSIRDDWLTCGDIAEHYSNEGQPVSALPYWIKFATGLNKNSGEFEYTKLWIYCKDVTQGKITHQITNKTIALFAPQLIDKFKKEYSLGHIDSELAEDCRLFVVSCVEKAGLD